MDEESGFPIIILTVFFSVVIVVAFYCYYDIQESRVQLRLKQMHTEYHERAGFSVECDVCKAQSFNQFIPQRK